MKKFYISDFILDLYSLDALSPKKRKMVETALTTDKELKKKYEAREKLTQDLLDRYKSRHPDDIIFQDQDDNVSDLKIKTFTKSKNLVRFGIAAAAVAVITLTFIFTFNYFKEHSVDDTNDIQITQEVESVESEKTESYTEQSSPLVQVSSDDFAPTMEHNRNYRENQYDPWMNHNPWQIINNQRFFIIPNGVEYIYDNQFFDNEITNVNIPNSVYEVGEAAFANNQLSSVTLPAAVRTIKDKAFDGNPLLSITIGENVSVGTDSFPGNFLQEYTRCSKTSGTYTRIKITSNEWIKQ